MRRIAHLFLSLIITSVIVLQILPSKQTPVASAASSADVMTKMLNTDMPTGLAVGPDNRLYFADANLHKVRALDFNGNVTTVAGTGTPGFSGDAGPGESAQLNRPQGLVYRPTTKQLYVADTVNNRVRKIDVSNYVIDSWFGSATPPDLVKNLKAPIGLTIDAGGRLYVADSGNHRVLMEHRGVVTVVAGTGTAGFSGDGGSATSANLNTPTWLAVDAAGNLYITDAGNLRIRKVTPAGVIATVVGGGTADVFTSQGPATSFMLQNPAGIVVDKLGNLYINESARLLTPLNGLWYYRPYILTVTPDGGLSNKRLLLDGWKAAGITIGSSGNLYVGTNHIPGDFYGDRTYSEHGIYKVFTLPLITAQPTIANENGTQATLSVTAYGSGTFTYQWYKGPVGDTTNQAEVTTCNSDTQTCVVTPCRSDTCVIKPIQTTSYWVRITHEVVSGSIDSAAVTVTVPTAKNIYRYVVPGEAITFRASEFKSAFTNPTGEPLAKIKVMTLPSGGTLFLNTTAVSSSQEIAVADLDRLMIPDWHGSVAWNWKASDGGLFSATTWIELKVSALYVSGLNSLRDAVISQDTLASGVFAPDGSYFFSDPGRFSIKRLYPGASSATIVAGNGYSGAKSDDGLYANNAPIYMGQPSGVTYGKGALYFIAGECVYKIASGTMTPVIGCGATGVSFTDAIGSPILSMSKLTAPRGILFKPGRNLGAAYGWEQLADELWVADGGQIYRVTLADTTTVILMFSGLKNPVGFALDQDGDIYIADAGAHTIYRTFESGNYGNLYPYWTIVPAIGTGVAGKGDDQAMLATFRINTPKAIAFDQHNNLLIADSGNNRILRYTPGWPNPKTVAGTGTAGISGEYGSLATNAMLNSPSGLAVSPIDGSLVMIQRVEGDFHMELLAGYVYGGLRTLLPLKAPTVTTQPLSQTITLGSSVGLSITVNQQAFSAWSYQWYQGRSGDTSAPISGATSTPIFIAPKVNTSYWVRANNGSLPLDSATADITINHAPVVTGTMSLTTPEDNSLVFSIADLSAHFSDSDGERLTQIAFLKLPSNGEIYVDSVRVANSLAVPLAPTSSIRFYPNTNWSGSTSFSWNGGDRYLLAVNGVVPVDITVTPVQDPPLVVDIPLSMYQTDRVITFTATLFTRNFTNIDGPALAKIKLTSLPLNGMLTLNGAAVTLNQEIAVATLGGLNFTSSPTWNGSVSFSWNGSDGAVYAPRSALVNISVLNAQPFVTNFTKPVWSTAPISFTLADFTKAFSDADDNSLTKIKITSLPTDGTLTLNGVAVGMDQEIASAEVAKLVWTPSTYWQNIVSPNFTWTASDWLTYANNSASVGVALNSAPTVTSFKRLMPENTTLSFMASDFTSGFKDTNGDPLAKITVQSLPSNGTLALNGVAVSLYQAIASADLGKLSFTPLAAMSGGVTFAWIASDGMDGSNIATVWITVGPFYGMLTTTATQITPTGLAFDAAGNLFIADEANSRVLKVTNGVTTTVAGTGIMGFSGDGGPATSAMIEGARDLAFDTAGNLFIATIQHIRKVDTKGIISTVATIAAPRGLTVDSAGNLFIAAGNTISKVDTAGTLTCVAGTGTAGFSGDGRIATSATLNAPSDVAVGADGTLYIADTGNNRIRKVVPSGTIFSYVVSNAGLKGPTRLAIDATGTLYIADTGNHRLSRMLPNGNPVTVAGTGTAGFNGDGDSSTFAQLNTPISLALDPQNYLAFADTGNKLLRLLTLTPYIFVHPYQAPISAGRPFTLTIQAIGSGLQYQWYQSSAGSAGTPISGATSFSLTTSLAVTTTTYWARVSNTLGSRDSDPAIVILNRLPTLSPLVVATNEDVAATMNNAGFRTSFTDQDAGDQLTTLKLVSLPSHGTFTFNGAPVSVDQTFDLTKVSLALTFTPDANWNGTTSFSWNASDGKGYADSPTVTNLTVNPLDDYPVVTSLGRGTKVNTTLNFTAANFTSHFTDVDGQSLSKIKVSVLPTSGTLMLNGVAVKLNQEIPSANLDTLSFVPPTGWSGTTSLSWAGSDGTNYGSSAKVQIIVTNALDQINTLVGTGVVGFSGDGGPATSAQLGGSVQVAVDVAGNLYIADTSNNAIRKMTPTGMITTIVGLATNVALKSPAGIAVDAAGNLFFANKGNNRVLKLTPAGVLTTIAGTGTAGFSGDGGSATSAMLRSPAGVAVDAAGNLFIADYGNHRIRKVTPAGIISTVAGVGTAGYTGDGSTATSTRLNYPAGVAVDATGNLFIADQTNHRIRKVTPAGIISTVAGKGTSGYSGDGAAATSAQLSYPQAVVIDAAGNLLIADTTNQTIRKVTSAGIISSLVGYGLAGFEGDGGPAPLALLLAPTSIAVDATGRLFIADSGNNRIRVVAPMVAPTITTQPLAQTLNAGQTVTLTTVVSGSNPLGYQWYQGSAGDTSKPVSGATGTSFTATLTASTTYWVRAANDAGTANSTAATITLNQRPTVVAVSKSGSEDTTLTFAASDFTGKFTDPENSSLTRIQVTSLPLSGTLKLSGVAVTVNQEIAATSVVSLTFVPHANWNGTTNFGWNGNDGSLYAATSAQVNLTLAAANDPPTVTSLTKRSAEDATLTFAASDFSGKFSDVDGDALAKIKVTTLPLSGTLKLSGVAVTLNQEIAVASLGNLTFVPHANWNGTTNFGWNGSDGTLYAATAVQVSLTITALNDPPTVAAVSKSGSEDTALAFALSDFTAKFSDLEGDSLAKVKLTTLPTSGTLMLNGVAVTLNQEIAVASVVSLTFVPHANWNGTTNFGWNGSDGTLYATTAAQVNLTIAPVNDAPTVAAVSKSGSEDTALAFALSDFSSKFSDLDGNSLAKIQVTTLPTNGTLKLSGVAVTLNQEIAVASVGNLKFVPNTNWNGTTNFGWNGSDGSLYAATAAQVSLTIAPVNDTPTVAVVTKTGTEDTALAFAAVNFSTSFSDIDGNSLVNVKVTTLPLSGTLKLSGVAVTVNQEIAATSVVSLTFVPHANWNGTTNFGWNGSDGTLYATTAAQVNLTIAPVNDAPTVAAITKSGSEDTTLAFALSDFTAKFSDLEGDSLAKVKVATLPTSGTLMLNGVAVTAGQEISATSLVSLTFAPNLNWNGTTNFGWSGSDGTDYAVTPAQVTLTLAAVSDAPTVADSSKSGTEDTALAFTATDFTSKFSDMDGNSLVSVTVTSLPANGTLNLNGITVTAGQSIAAASLGSLSFLPNLNWNGTTNFSWNGSNGPLVAVTPAQVSITITAVNDPPTLTTVSKNGTEDTTLTFAASDFTGAFSDLEGDSLVKVKVITLPLSGTLTLNGVAVTVNQEISATSLVSLSFAPNLNWNGTTNFGWSGSDGTDYAVTPAQVTLTLAAVSDAPTVVNGSTPGREDTPLGLTASVFGTFFSDSDGDLLASVTVLSLPANGTLNLNGVAVTANQTLSATDLANLTFTPDLNWNGTTNFGWNGSDGTANAATPAQLTLAIAAVNDPPTIGTGSTSGLEDTSKLSFFASDFTSVFNDFEGSSLVSVTVTTLPANGTLRSGKVAVTLNQVIAAANLGNLNFMPSANWNGTTSFGWNASDGTAYAVTPAQMNIVITAVNDAPTVAAVSKSGTANTTLGFATSDFSASFSDVDGNSLVSVTVTSLPVNGTLNLNGVAVTVNQVIAAADVGNLSFVPNSNWGGTTTFGWNGSDGALVAVTPAQVIMVVNAPPSISVVNKSGTEDTTLTFATSDVGGGTIASVTVMNLPANGTLTLNGVAVTANQVIATADVGSLSFVPSANWNGNTNFGWNATDGTTYAVTQALVDLTIAAVNDPPTLSAFNKVGTQAITLTFANIDFSTSTSFSDVDVGNSLVSVTVVSLPANGTLNLNGGPVTVNQVLTAANLDMLSFIPNASWTGTTTFDWNASDGTASAVTPAQVMIRIEPPPFTITTVAGSGTNGFSGDGGPALSATLNGLDGLGINAAGELFIADTNNHRVRRVDSTGTITTVTGNGVAAYSGDGGDATLAQVNTPAGLTLDAAGDLYLADAGNKLIRKVTSSTQTITTVAGNVAVTTCTDGLLATSSCLSGPKAVVVDAAGNLFIADRVANRIRKVTPAGIITTVAGTGMSGFSGDGGPATSAMLYSPSGVAVDAAGNLFIADTGNQRIRKVTPAGIITTVAGTGINGFSGDGGLAMNAKLSLPAYIVVDAAGNLYFFANITSRIRRVDSAGIITTVAGTGTAGFSGDDGPSTSAMLSMGLNGFAVDSAGNLYVSDVGNVRVRKLTRTTPLQSASVEPAPGGSITGTHAPTVAEVGKTGPANTPVAFAATDFSAAFSDPAGDALALIIITSLPTNGTLTLNGVAVNSAQSIASADLGNLRFVPNADWSGTTTFGWNGSDGTLLAVTPAQVTLTITAPTTTAQPPSVYRVMLPLLMR